MTESPEHLKAKKFVADTLRKHGLHMEIEKKMHRIVRVSKKESGTGQAYKIPMQWTFDVYAEIPLLLVYDYALNIHDIEVNRHLDIEIDGYKGHGRLRQRRDAVRDAHFKAEGYEVYRFPLRYFVGKKRMTEEELLKELHLA